MSIESAKAFTERMKTDNDFAKKVKACKDADTFRSLVRDAGFDFNKDEIRELEGELNDAELEMVCGGYLGQRWYA